MIKNTLPIFLFIITCVFTVGRNVPSTSKKIRIPPIHFKSNSVKFIHRNDAGKIISYDSIFTNWKWLLEQNPDIDLELHGYRDKNERQKLSLMRANKVKSELIKVGVKNTRLSVKDCGDNEELYTQTEINDNRRVEFVITVKE